MIHLEDLSPRQFSDVHRCVRFGLSAYLAKRGGTLSNPYQHDTTWAERPPNGPAAPWWRSSFPEGQSSKMGTSPRRSRSSARAVRVRPSQSPGDSGATPTTGTPVAPGGEEG